MIGNSLSFAELKECSVGYVTFGDGVKGTVVRKGNIDRFGALVLSNVRLVEGLSTNLISISQLCNEGFMVNFFLKINVKC